MTLEEIQACAAETLALFFETMPDIPFAPEDIVIEIAPKREMVARARALCAKYVPDKIINDSQAKQLNATIAANALIGREKSAILARIDHRRSRQDWRTVTTTSWRISIARKWRWTKASISSRFTAAEPRPRTRT